LNSLIINFDNAADLKTAYTRLKKKYPKIEIADNSKNNATQELQEVMEIKLNKLGIKSEEEFMDWINGVIKETRRERRGESIV